MKLPLPTRESVELWQQGSTGDSRRANHRRTASVTSQEELARLIHVEFRRQLVRYLKRRVAERNRRKPNLISRLGAWVKSKFRKPRPELELVVDEAAEKREAWKAGEIHLGNCKRGNRKGQAARRNKKVRALLENPNLLRVVQTIVYEHDYFDRMMREVPGR